MIYMIGVSEDVPLNIRQKLSFTKSRLRDALLSIKLYVEGCVILSTCNRTEIYVEGDNKVDEIIDILEFRDFKDTFFIKRKRSV